MRIRAYVSALGVFVESISNVACAIVLGSCSFRESGEKSREKSGSTVGQA